MADAPGAVIVGASRQGRVVLAVWREAGVAVRGFADDDPGRWGEVVDGVAVLGSVAECLRRGWLAGGAIVAIGGNDARLAVAGRLRSAGVRLVPAVHPSAVVMDGVVVGDGCVVAAGAVLVAGTTLEGDVLVNTGATVDHDSLLEAGAQLASGVHTAGGVVVGRGAFVGVGAVLGPGVRIGAGTVVGAGSVVLDDLPEGVMAWGTPARPVRTVPRPLDWRAILGGPNAGPE